MEANCGRMPTVKALTLLSSMHALRLFGTFGESAEIEFNFALGHAVTRARPGAVFGNGNAW